MPENELRAARSLVKTSTSMGVFQGQQILRYKTYAAGTGGLMNKTGGENRKLLGAWVAKLRHRPTTNQIHIDPVHLARRIVLRQVQAQLFAGLKQVEQ